MRRYLGLVTLVAAGATGCGTDATPPTASAPSELAFAMSVNPDPRATGGVSSSSVVTLMVHEASPGAQLTGATLTLFDAQGAVLTREAAEGPIAFGTDGTLRFQRALSWTATNVLGRGLNVQFTVARADGSSRVVDRTVDF